MKEQLFKILAKAKIKDQRSVVISKFAKGGYTISQQIEVTEGSKTLPIFIKGSTHIDSLEGLYNVRDALNEAINIEEDELSRKNSK